MGKANQEKTTGAARKAEVPVDQVSRLRKCLEEPEIESWRALMGAFQAVYRRLESALLIENCSISRFQILFFLYFDGPMPASKIAKRLFVTRGNISMFLRRLQSDGLIETVKGKTERSSSRRPFYGLTRRGQDFFEDLFPRHARRVRALVPPMGSNLLDTLRSIREKAETLHDLE